MEFLTSPTVVVFLILIFVAVAALKFEPSEYAGKWQTLHEWFATESRPLHVSHPQASLLVTGYAHCDVTTEADGMWIVYDGPVPPKLPPCLFIPWPHFMLKTSTKNDYVFQLKKDAATRKVITIIVRADLGEAMVRHIPKRTGMDS